MAICVTDALALLLAQFRMAGVDFLLGGGDQCIEQIVGLNTKALASRDLDVRLALVFFVTRRSPVPWRSAA